MGGERRGRATVLATLCQGTRPGAAQALCEAVLLLTVGRWPRSRPCDSVPCPRLPGSAAESARPGWVLRPSEHRAGVCRLLGCAGRRGGLTPRPSLPAGSRLPAQQTLLALRERLHLRQVRVRLERVRQVSGAVARCHPGTQPCGAAFTQRVYALGWPGGPCVTTRSLPCLRPGAGSGGFSLGYHRDHLNPQPRTRALLRGSDGVPALSRMGLVPVSISPTPGGGW